MSLFGNLTQHESIFQASEIVEELKLVVPDRKPFLCTSPSISWGSAVGFHPGMMELIYGPKSCISSESFLRYEVWSKDGKIRRNHKGGTIKRLYERFHNISSNDRKHGEHLQNNDSSFFVKSVNDDGGIFRNEVLDVVKCGVKKCFIVKTSDGRSLISTLDHKFLTFDGYLPLSEINVGDSLFIQNGEHLGRVKYPTRPTVCVKYHPVYPQKIVKDVKYGYENLYYRGQKHRAIYEAHMNKMSYDEYIEALNTWTKSEINELSFIPSDIHVHHIDEDYRNNSISNLTLIDPSEHGKIHMNDRRSKLREYVSPSMIESIVEVGDIETYDLKCSYPYNNYIANDIVVHNCGKTMLTLDRIKSALAEDPESIAVFVDAEMTMEYDSTIKWMAANGVDVKRVLIVREVCIKKIFEEVLLKDINLAIKNDGVKVAIVVMDSIQAMSVLNIPSTEKQIKKAGTEKGSVTKQDYGARANYLSRIFPFYRKFSRDNRIYTSFIGQARVKGQDMFGNVIWDTNGGEALFHEVQYRMLVERAGESDKNVIYDPLLLDANGNPKKIGHKIKFKFEKNKAGEGQDRTGTCDIAYMQGIINTESEMVEICAKLGIVNQTGAWYNYDGKKYNGSKPFADYLRENPKVYAELFGKVMGIAS